MWYVLQAAAGREEHIALDVEKVLAVDDCQVFVPKYVCARRYQGSWHQELRVLFPGYIFVDTENPEVVQKKLQVLTSQVQPVCIGGGFNPIRYEEQQFLQNVMNGMHEIGFSVGNIVGGKLIVDEGPLKNVTHYVCRIDRHKRLAEVEVCLWGEEHKVKVGLEVREKV